MPQLRIFLLVVIFSGLLVGCMLDATTPLPPTIMPSLPVPIHTPDTITSLPPVVGWEVLAPGLEKRSYFPDDKPLAEIVALRIDPDYYTFRVHYRPGDARVLSWWIDELPGAVALVNANYFDPQEQIVGLLIADGIKYGWSYQNYGGLFAVQGGIPRVRSNVDEPYNDEALEQAVQAFPMLVLNGESVYQVSESDRVTRRTAIGQDVQGRIILMATPFVGLKLVEFSNFLATTDMGLVNAFNLDGGGSTMMSVIEGERPYLIRSFDPVPAVLAVYVR